MTIAADILRRAAEMVNETHYLGPIPLAGCRAIKEAGKARPWEGGTNMFDAIETFKLMGPEYTFGYWWNHPTFSNEQENNARVMALLFAAEMVK